tara:strand:- start:711 stop:908 length:198 start_codon:yes stop_codon:yes gene_type:complete
MFNEITSKINSINSSDTNNNVQKYFNSLTEEEKQVLIIAYEHLESSFNIEKSVGYITFIKNNNLE